jgi:hypothetical protein
MLSNAAVRLSLFWVLFGGALGLQAQTTPAKPTPPQIPDDPAIYFYNPRLDALGQNAQKAGADVASGQIFDTEIDNLKVMLKLATDRIFTSARRAALARIEGARNWKTLYEFVEKAKEKSIASSQEKEEWPGRIEDLKKQITTVQEMANDTAKALTAAGGALQDIGNAQEVIQFATLLSKREPAAVTKTDLRVIGKVQEALVNLGTILSDLGKQTQAPSSRSAVDQMKIDLAKAEVDHLKALIKIEDRRMAGQKDVKSLIAAIEDTLTCTDGNCGFSLKDDDGNEIRREEVLGKEQIDATLLRYKQQGAPAADRLKAVVYLLENFAAFSARAETPGRIADLRRAIEERSFAIRRDAIMARSYEQIFLLGTQRIALYYKGGIKPETLAQFAQAAATAGLIPAITFK